MYYAIFEAVPYEGKEKLAEQFYMSLLPHLDKFKGNGFHEDAFSGAVHRRKGVNVAVWDDAEAAWGWRNEENHLRLQKKGSETVYESYRIRLGPEVPKSEEPDNEKTRHYMTLLYRSSFEGTPPDDVAELLESGIAGQLKGEVVDSTVYKGAQTLWITTWRSQDAAIHFEQSITSLPEDTLLRIRVERDYTKSDRNDAPHEMPGMQ